MYFSARLRAGSAHGKGGAGVVVPWFALCFILASGFNSLHWLPAAWVGAIVQIDTVLLAMAMAALGLIWDLRPVPEKVLNARLEQAT